ncbi:hypothetical protein GOODEAATRI_020210 [Goodea atripinnis]|uniref:Uncharacterized protein n=1 Tax=Goodea atripinnis TaxID=208336 RepID=A0ABV0PQV4_9TELE
MNPNFKIKCGYLVKVKKTLHCRRILQKYSNPMNIFRLQKTKKDQGVTVALQSKVQNSMKCFGEILQSRICKDHFSMVLLLQATELLDVTVLHCAVNLGESRGFF